MEEWRNIDGMYSTVGIEPLHRKRYTKEEVSKIAQKYTRMVDFAKGIDKKYYYCAYRHGWLDDICKHMEPRADIFRRDIYVYDILYQGKKYAYVGLTYNVEHRHKQHLRDSRDAIFKFKHKTGCEIPYPEILYRNLDVDSASKKEDEMIQEYKSHGYIMLNRIKGGSTGGLQGRSYTWDECKEIGKKYRSLHEWEKNESKSYYFSRYHFHDELILFGKQLRCNREDVPKFSSDLTDVELVNLASKYKKKFDFCREHKTYYNELVKNSHVRFVRPPESEYCFWWLTSQINGASLVFPDTGFKDNYDWEEEGTGFYWASDQKYYQFYEDKEIEREINVSFGLCIRPVIKER